MTTLIRLALFAAVSTILLSAPAQEPKKAPPAGEPKVLYPIPLAVRPGFKGKVVLRGLRLDGVSGVTAEDPKVRVTADKPKKVPGPKEFAAEKVGDAELGLELNIPWDFSTDFLELVVAGPADRTTRFRLTVAVAPAVPENEPNDSFAAAQALTLPAAVDGRVERDKDVDVYRFVGKAGQKVRVAVQAARLGSPVDALVVVYDADRRVLDSCDDVDGQPDPDLTVPLPRDGAYYVSVIDARDLGGACCPYRLTITAK